MSSISNIDSTSTRRILVLGATGNQGGGVVRALAKYNTSDKPRFVILAVTRNPESGSAKTLKAILNVELVKGDLDAPDDIFKAAGAVDAMYSVQTVIEKGAVEAEERQGKALIDASAKAGVQQIVYSSVDFGGLDKTDVPHFESKRHIEEYIQSKYPSIQLTVLRPVTFMENLNNLHTFMGKTMATFFVRQVKKGVKLQLIATSDIGHYAALAFAEPDKYAGQKISLAGDELTGDEIAKQFQEVKGTPLPTTFTIVTTMAKMMVKEARTMFNFFNTTGHAANIPQLRSEYPDLKTFKQWLATEHK